METGLTLYWINPYCLGGIAVYQRMYVNYVLIKLCWNEIEED